MLSNITYGFSQYHIIAIDSDEGHILELNFPQICSIDWALPLAYVFYFQVLIIGRDVLYDDPESQHGL